MQLRTVEATRYVTPLREGGSLPALVEASDDGLYVLKFRGAGQGPRALVAELLSGENLVPSILDCARAYATLYEIRHAMERVFGSSKEPVFF